MLAKRTAGLAVQDVGAFARMSHVDHLRESAAFAPTLDQNPLTNAVLHSEDRPAIGPANGTLAGTTETESPRTGRERTRWMWLALTFIIGGALSAGTLAFEQRGDADRAALVESVRKAIGKGRYVTPPDDNARDLLTSGLRRWPSDPTLMDLRSDAEHALVTRSMAAHSGGDIEGAYSAAEKALAIDPSSRSANLLADEYGLELRSLTADAALAPGSPCVLFDPPTTATAGTTVDVNARVVIRSAAHAAINAPKLTLTTQRENVAGTALPLVETSPGVFKSRLLLSGAPTRIYLVFEATVDGNLLRAERAVDVQP